MHAMHAKHGTEMGMGMGCKTNNQRTQPSSAKMACRRHIIIIDNLEKKIL